jgi:hypothetical protein
MKLNDEQLKTIGKFYANCIAARKDAESKNFSDSVRFHQGQLDGVEMTINILTGANPHDVLDDAQKLLPAS